MIGLPPKKNEPKRDANVALINIVFLMLIFFLLASTILPPHDRSVTLINTSEAQPSAPPNALWINADGALTHLGQHTNLENYLIADTDPVLRIVPDQNLPAEILLSLVEQITRKTDRPVRIITRRQP